MDLSIMPECYADTLLIETFVPPVKGYNHKASCNKVEIGVKNFDGFALGIVDNDKKVIPYLRMFEIIDEVEDSLKLWKHPLKHHYFIQIIPALEKWILNVCKKTKIVLGEFDLPQDFENFVKITKSMASFKDQRLKALFKKMSEKEDLVEVRKLRGWISLLKEKNFKVDINELKHV